MEHIINHAINILFAISVIFLFVNDARNRIQDHKDKKAIENFDGQIHLSDEAFQKLMEGQEFLVLDKYSSIKNGDVIRFCNYNVPEIKLYRLVKGLEPIYDTDKVVVSISRIGNLA